MAAAVRDSRPVMLRGGCEWDKLLFRYVDGGREDKNALKILHAWLVARGIEPKVPAGGAKIGYLSPLKHKVPERLYLCPSRESGKPFVSFYLYDRNNNYMHCCGDGQGRLYEYRVDGAKCLHSSAKYTSGRSGIGPAAYDMLSVLPPDMIFPVTKEGEMGGQSADTWRMASLSVPFCLNCRYAPDSKNRHRDETEQCYSVQKKWHGHPRQGPRGLARVSHGRLGRGERPRGTVETTVRRVGETCLRAGRRPCHDAAAVQCILPAAVGIWILDPQTFPLQGVSPPPAARSPASVPRLTPGGPGACTVPGRRIRCRSAGPGRCCCWSGRRPRGRRRPR